MIDPTIALRAGQGIPQFDPMAAAQRGLTLRQLATQVQFQPQLLQQELSSAQAAEAATRASTEVTRTQAKSSAQQYEEQARQLAASRRLAEIGKSYTSIDKTTGKVVINKEGILHQALSEGVPFEQVGKLATEVASFKEKDLRDVTSRQDYAQNRLYELDHILRVQTDPAKAAGMVDNMQKRLSDVLGPEKAQEYLQSRYGVDPTQIIERAKVNASSGISPAQQEQFKISNEQLRQTWANIGIAQRQLIESGVANLTSPEAMNPNSSVSQAYRDLAVKAGVPESQVRSLSAAQIHRIPGIADVTTSVVPTTGARTEGVITAKGYETDAGVIKQGIQTIEAELKTKYGKPGTITRSAWNQLTAQDPRYAAVQSAIDQHNALNPNAKLDILDGFDAIARRLSISANKLESQAKGAREMAASPNLAATARGTVKMVAPNGAIYNIPADRVDEMKSRGLKEAK